VAGKVFGLIGAAIGLVVVAAIVFVFVAGHPYRIPSSSMEPTLHCAKPQPGCTAKHSDRFLVFKFLHWGRGDIVAFHTPELARERCGAGGTYVKRVIGLPGDRVAERNGVFYVDGRKLAEPYVSPARRAHDPARSWRVPAGSYFLVGDNRAQSCDSRVFGPVSKGAIVGKLTLVYWPPSRISFR
jgi:signal peptidase I